MELGEKVRKVFDRFYEHPWLALAIPLLMLLLSLGILLNGYLGEGEMLDKGIDFTGGTEAHVPVYTDSEISGFQAAFPDSTVREMSGGETRWFIVESRETYDTSDITRILEDEGIDYRQDTDISIRSLGASVGEAFFQEAQFWAGVALLIMSAVIFIAFRSLVPSFAVIFAALTDIIFAMAGMSLLGIDLTLGSLAALLMLLGYSVDTDILLSTRVLKQRKNDIEDRIWSSVMTGSAMTFAAIAAFTVLYLVSPAGTLDQISSVIIIGLWADLPVTWFGNAFILKMYVEGDW